MMLGMYVDDLVISHNCPDLFSDFMDALVDNYDCTYLGKLHWYLGMEVLRGEDGSVFVNQSKYIKDKLERKCLLNT